jgi:hypothetical protein
LRRSVIQWARRKYKRLRPQPKVHETGWSGCAVPTPRSLHIGHYVMATAEHREPYDSRGSPTVLGAPGSENPGAASKAADLKRWKTFAVNCPFGRLAYPMRGEATNRVLLGRKRHGRPGIQIGCQRWERPGWQQTRRFEDYRMIAAAKTPPVLKSLNGFLWNSRPRRDWGKADATGEGNGQVHPVSHRSRGPGIRDAVGLGGTLAAIRRPLGGSNCLSARLVRLMPCRENCAGID